ncbi:MAG: hypothetical protein HY926_04795 [Elusimicrobia bacterium]|nr:hypothetical protein [Elusimicrobiota bacterium]
MARSSVHTPVLLRFPGEVAREDGWGRLLELCASSAKLSTQTPLDRGEQVRLAFEVNGERFADLRARVESVDRDEDGFLAADLSFQDEVEKRRLARSLADLLSRQVL